MMRTHLLLTLIAWLIFATPTAGVQRGVVVTGTVIARAGAGIAGAVVHVETMDRTVVTARDGSFEVDGVVPGSHTVMVSAAGFAPRRYRFTIPSGRTRGQAGTIVLTVSDRATITVAGTVRDAESGAGIPRVPIRINGRVVALSDGAGRYSAETELNADLRDNVVEARRIGYRPGRSAFGRPESRQRVDVDLALQPAPVELEAIRVQGEEVELSTGRLDGFFRRRSLGLGHFFTRTDIERMNAIRVSDVIRRVPGAVVITEESVNADPFGAQPRFSQLPKTTIRFQQRGGYARPGGDRPCSPLLFVNDVMVHHEDFDTITRTRDIAGMEVYASAAQVPVEYNRLGAACGVIAIWTDGRTGGGRLAADFEIGATFVGAYPGGGARQHLGVQMLIPLFGSVELRPSFSIIVSGNSDFNAGWQAIGTAAVHPIRSVPPWYVGAGFAATRVRPAFAGALSPPRSEATYVMVTGLAVPIGVFRPFGELQSLESFGAGRSLQFAFGVTVRTSRSAPPTPF